MDARFKVKSVNKFYYFDKWDADEDGENIFNCLKSYIEYYDDYMQRKEEIVRDGADTLWAYELELGEGWFWKYNGCIKYDCKDFGISDESELEEWMRSRNIQVKGD